MSDETRSFLMDATRQFVRRLIPALFLALLLLMAAQLAAHAIRAGARRERVGAEERYARSPMAIGCGPDSAWNAPCGPFTP